MAKGTSTKTESLSHKSSISWMGIDPTFNAFEVIFGDVLFQELMKESGSLGATVTLLKGEALRYLDGFGRSFQCV